MIVVQGNCVLLQEKYELQRSCLEQGFESCFVILQIILQ